MKATGIVRRIDDLGRVVIPKEIRRTLRIREGDPLEIFVDHLASWVSLLRNMLILCLNLSVTFPLSPIGIRSSLLLALLKKIFLENPLDPQLKKLWRNEKFSV